MSEVLDGILSSLQEPEQNNRSRIGKVQRWFAASTIAGLILTGVVVTPVADMMLVVIPGFFAMFHVAMFVVNLLLAALLFIKGEIEGRGDTTRLAAAYLYVTLITVAQLASFPGGFMPTALIGTPQSPIWIWFFWHVGFGLLIIRYAWLASREPPPRSSWRASVIVVPALFLLATWISATYAERLPSVASGGHFVISGGAMFMFIPVATVTVVALASVVSLRATTPERLWLIVGLVASSLEVWLSVRGAARFSLGWYVAKMGSMITSLVVLISLLHEITLLYREAAASNAMLRRLVRLDGLTGLYNRRGFDELLHQEFRRAQRHEQPLGLVMIDVDFFKGYNDRYGHQAGDDCLRQVSDAVKDALWRPSDHAARYGGEEIALLLAATDLRGAVLIAERARAAVAALEIPHGGSPMGIVTISAGVSSLLPLQAGDHAADLVEGADHALYQAKKEGRNQVCAGTADIVAAAGLHSAEV
jgi:diguanylate cyclase (GGDEF)-like protein